jgi:hypothetical protein
VAGAIRVRFAATRLLSSAAWTRTRMLPNEESRLEEQRALVAELRRRLDNWRTDSPAWWIRGFCFGLEKKLESGALLNERQEAKLKRLIQ